MKREEGFISVKGGKVWYEIVGEKKAIPLLVLHGGPGYPHDYLQPLEDLAKDRQIIFYDQLGCGNSSKTKDKKLWTVKHFVQELGEIVNSLKLEQYHILGQSWGAALGVSFAITKPKGLKSLVLSDPYLSSPAWEKDAEKLIGQLPKPMQKALKQNNTSSKAYKKASKEYYDRFVWRLDKKSVSVQKAENKFNAELYTYMWGPYEYRTTGTLKKFDLSYKLSQIKVPVLLLCGQYDEATPESTKFFASKLQKSKTHIFSNSAHMPFWTDRKNFMETVASFLASVDK